MKKTYLKKKICKLYRIISNPPYYKSKSNVNITLRSEKRRKFRVKELCLQKAMIPLPKKKSKQHLWSCSERQKPNYASESWMKSQDAGNC